MAVASSGRAPTAGLLARRTGGLRASAPVYAANVLTAARLLSIPVIVLATLGGRFETALWLFGLAALTDIADGFIAKRFNGVSPLGTILDPAADKLLLGSVIAALAGIGAVPIWLVVVVLGRDLFLALGAGLWQLRVGHLRIEPLAIGKATTFLQLLYVGAVLGSLGGHELLRPFLAPLAAFVVALTLTSAAAYAGALRMAEPPREAPAGSASPAADRHLAG